MASVFKIILFSYFIILSHLTVAAPQPHQGAELLGSHFKRSPAAKKLASPIKDLLVKEFKTYLKGNYKNQSSVLAKHLIKESSKYNLDPVFILSIVKTESHFDPEAIGGVGEIGLMQLRPETAQWIANKYKIKISGNIQKQLKKPTVNLTIGIAYMDYLRERFNGEASMYLPAYNSGPNKVKKLAEQNIKPKIYSLKVMKNYGAFYGKWAKQNESQLIVKN